MADASLTTLWWTTVERHADRPALTVRGATATWGELHAEVLGWARWLTTRGVRPGDRVVLLLPNSTAYVVGYCGTQLAGGVVVGLHPELLPGEAVRLVQHCDARVVVAPSRAWSGLVEAGCGGGDRVLVAVGAAGAEGLPAGVCRWPDAAMVAGLTNPLPKVAGRAPAQIIYTSGTTGRPKGVVLSHAALWANTNAIVDCLGLTADDSGLASLPFFYSYGNSVLLTHMAVGARLVLADDVVFWNRNLDQLIAERVTGFSAVPSTFALLLSRWGFESRAYPDLRYVTCAGGALAPDLLGRLRATLPGAALHVMYGQTEASARLSMLPPSELERRPGSIGRGLPGVELRLVDELGVEVPAGEVGEIVARGPNLMEGYWQDPELTRDVLRDGWLHTGDLARQDGDGYLSIVGRRSDMIKSGSWRLAPQELEELFWSEQGVAEVAVAGRPDPLLGEVPVAFVVPTGDRTCDPDELLMRVNARLPRFKRLHAVRLVQALPRTSTGKVRRDVLRDWADAAGDRGAGPVVRPGTTAASDAQGGPGDATADRGTSPESLQQSATRVEPRLGAVDPGADR